MISFLGFFFTLILTWSASRGCIVYILLVFLEETLISVFQMTGWNNPLPIGQSVGREVGIEIGVRRLAE